MLKRKHASKKFDWKAAETGKFKESDMSVSRIPNPRGEIVPFPLVRVIYDTPRQMVPARELAGVFTAVCVGGLVWFAAAVVLAIGLLLIH